MRFSIKLFLYLRFTLKLYSFQRNNKIALQLNLLICFKFRSKTLIPIILITYSILVPTSRSVKKYHVEKYCKTFITHLIPH